MGETTVVFRRDETIVGNCDDLLCFETKLNRKKLPVDHKSQAWLMASIDPQKEFHCVRKRVAACLLIALRPRKAAVLTADSVVCDSRD